MLPELTPGQILLWVVGLFSCTTIVEIAPIRWNPWTTLGDWIGRALNRETTKRVEQLQESIVKLGKTVQQRSDLDDERHIKGCRRGLL